MAKLRILSLLPAATEIVFALGLKDYLVGVSGDSDYPDEAKGLPKVVTTTLPKGLTSRQIDDWVRGRRPGGPLARKVKHRGAGIFHIDEQLLKRLSPNLILSQELCEVCAIGASVVKKAARILKNPVRTISLEPESVSDVFENIKLVGEITDRESLAKRLVLNQSKRIKKVELAAKKAKHKPRVLIVEWLDPVMVAGHWVPEMVDTAGGFNLVSKRKEVSKRIPLQDILSLDPDILIIAPCGFDIDRTKGETKHFASGSRFKKLKAAKENSIYLADGNAYLTRPGPRIVDGIEILSQILHPEIFQNKHNKKDWQKMIY